MNTSHISKEWIDTFNRLGSEGKLKATVDYDAIFNLDELFGKKLYTLPMGHVVFPTGHIVVCDPLTHLAAVDNKSYIRIVEPGTYPIETKVAELDTDYYKYVLTRVVFKDTKPVQYELALKGHEDLSELDDGESYIGFPVDAGLATIVDKVTVDAYKEFDRQWYENNPDGNIYDDYFDELFKLNALANPKFQRSGGDWINFNIPDTNLYVPMVQSGFGDGLYPVYWAFDEEGDICQIIIEFISCSDEPEE